MHPEEQEDMETMALTRKLLDALGIESDKADQIIEAHGETVNGLKDEIAKWKKEADGKATVQKELDDLKAAKDSGNNPYKDKYEALQKEFDAYKENVSKEAENRAKTTALRELLKGIGVNEKRLDAVMKVTKMDDIQLDADGNIENAADLRKQMKTEWADFITTEEKHGADTANPPANNGGTIKTRADVYKTDEHGRFLLDATQRQAELSKIIAAEQQKGN